MMHLHTVSPRRATMIGAVATLWLFAAGCQQTAVQQKQDTATTPPTTEQTTPQTPEPTTFHSSSQPTSMRTTPPAQIDMTLADTCTDVVITTTKGAITISLMSADAPMTVANFCTLAKQGFYDNVIFHRVIAGFMIQGGDPDGTGMGGPGYQFADEIHANNHNVAGTIAMANAGPGTNGSQFFINVADNAFLDTKHTVFGTVTAGMDVVRAIEAVPTGPADKPTEDVRIERIVVREK